MYLQSDFAESRQAVLHEVIHKHPLATFISSHDDEIAVDHFPLILTESSVGDAVLRGHIPRANSIWEGFAGREAVAVFTGPQAYVSPAWYPSKRVHGKVVPTWNYVVVHARGCPTAIDDRDWLRAHLVEITDRQEASRSDPWKVSDAPEDFLEQMMGHVVGIELPIRSLSGKWKVSQNRPVADRLGVAAGLHELGDDNSVAMEQYVLETLELPDES